MNLLIFGDSITQGFYDEERGGWCSRFAAYSMQKNADDTPSIFNLGVSGDCTNRLLGRFDGEIQARANNKKDTAVLFAIGVNDTQRYVKTNEIKTPEKEFRNNLGALHSKTSKYSDTIVFTGILPIIEDVVQPMPWADDRSHYSKDVIQYDRIIRDVCLEKKCSSIPFQDIFSKHDLRDVLADGIHPNAKGHQLIFEHVKKYLEQEGII